jgi:hypothetical protein
MGCNICFIDYSSSMDYIVDKCFVRPQDIGPTEFPLGLVRGFFINSGECLEYTKQINQYDNVFLLWNEVFRHKAMLTVMMYGIITLNSALNLKIKGNYEIRSRVRLDELQYTTLIGIRNSLDQGDYFVFE